MADLILLHADDSQRRYHFHDLRRAEEACAALLASPWIPEPKCPCCEMQEITFDGQTLTRYALEDAYVDRIA